MKLIPHDANKNEVQFKNGISILFSFQTVVAAFIPGRGYVQTATKYSATTSRHVNSWAGKDAEKIPQSELDSLVADK